MVIHITFISRTTQKDKAPCPPVKAPLNAQLGTAALTIAWGAVSQRPHNLTLASPRSRPESALTSWHDFSLHTVTSLIIRTLHDTSQPGRHRSIPLLDSFASLSAGGVFRLPSPLLVTPLARVAGGGAARLPFTWGVIYPWRRPWSITRVITG